MTWITYALAAIGAEAAADIFRKLAVSLKDPFFVNLIFQSGAFIMAVFLYLLFSRKHIAAGNEVTYAFLGGLCISLFTILFLKALAIGPGIATVSPAIRIGVVIVVTLVGLFLFREKLTWNLITGIILASTGVYLIFLNK